MTNTARTIDPEVEAHMKGFIQRQVQEQLETQGVKNPGYVQQHVQASQAGNDPAVARIEQQLAEMRQSFGSLLTGASSKLDGVSTMVANLGVRVDAINARVDGIAAVTNNLPNALLGQLKLLKSEDSEKAAASFKEVLAADRYVSLDKGLVGDAATVVAVGGGAVALYELAKRLGYLG